jgi:hypothetical protein
VLQRETVVAAPMTCMLAGNTFSAGSMSCQGGYQFRCTNGSWERIDTIC